MPTMLDKNKKSLNQCKICTKKIYDYKYKNRQYCSLACWGKKLQKGKRITYSALHLWIRRRLEKPEKCHGCHEVKKLDLANISQQYKQKLEDWEWLCRSCHMKKDGRLTGLSTARAKRTNFRQNPWGYKGISWYKPYGKWQARLTINKKAKHIGYFENLDEAIEALKKAEKEAYE